MDIECINPLETADWDAQVGQFDAATFFHTVAWARTLCGTYGFTPHYLIASEAGKIAGVLPMMEVSTWLTRRRGVSLPFSDHCEPLAVQPAGLRRLYDAALETGLEHGWADIEVRGGAARVGAPASITFHRHLLPLQVDFDALARGTDSSVRRAIRKAERSDVEVVWSNQRDALRDFHALFVQTRRKHGAPPPPWRFFEQIHQHVLTPGYGHIVLARHAGKAVAGAIFFHFRHAAVFKFGASDPACQHLRPNHLLLWRAIEWYATHGGRTLDLGRTSLANDGLRRFKLSWGTREEPLEYVRVDVRTHVFRTTADRAAGWHTSVFKCLPSGVSRLIGAALYRHLA